MKKVLVSGASGFVGRHLVRDLSDRGTEIVALIRSGQAVDLVSASYSWEQLEQIEFCGIEAIVHLAGKAHDVRNTADESEYFEVNVGLTERLAEAASAGGFGGKFVHFSSVKAIADAVEGTLDETFPPDPRTAYGRSKLASEKSLARIFSDRQDGLFIIRPCMIHGPGNKGNLNLLYRFVGRKIPFPLGAFDNQRSLLGIDNLCHIVAQIISGSVPGGTYHLADNETISTSRIVSVIAEVSGKSHSQWKVPRWIVRSLAKIGDWLPLPLNSDRLQKLTENYVVSNAKISGELEQPLPCSLEEGLVRTVKSF